MPSGAEPDPGTSSVQPPSLPPKKAIITPMAEPPDHRRGLVLPTVARESYQIDHELARGGLGRILVARDRRLGRTVAIKELLPGESGEARFVREALVTANLEHPGIVPIHEAGRWPSGEPFYAMKLVSGRPLSEAIRDTPLLAGRLGLLANVIAVAEAIAYAHSRHVIHRDIKPPNVIIGQFGETVVIDWGLAKDLRAPEPADEDDALGPDRTISSDDRTLAGDVIGTPAYMPPEQARGEAVDERADVYALGALLYHLLSGSSPYSPIIHIGTGDGRDQASRAPTHAQPAASEHTTTSSPR